MYSLARNHFFCLIQAIEDIDSNAKEEMKAEEQVMYTMVMPLLLLPGSTADQQCSKTLQLHNPMHTLHAYNI